METCKLQRLLYRSDTERVTTPKGPPHDLGFLQDLKGSSYTNNMKRV